MVTIRNDLLIGLGALCLLTGSAVFVMATPATAPASQPTSGPAPATELDAHRLLGTAHYENDEFVEAANAFRRCVELAPESAADQFNLGLVLMRASDYAGALHALARARQLDPELLAASYVEGIVYKRQNEYAKAIEDLQRVIGCDPQCWGAYYNLGVCQKALEQYEPAIATFEQAARIAPDHPNAHYQLITLYRRVGKVDDAKRHSEVFERLKNALEDSEKTAEALERSRYSHIIAAARTGRELAPAPQRLIRFVDVTAAAGLATAARTLALSPLPVRCTKTDYRPDEVRDRYVPAVGGAVALGDVDGDGDLDIYWADGSAGASAPGNRLYRNEGSGHFADITAEAGVAGAPLGLAAIFGDVDNDGHDDLYIVNCGANLLYHQGGDGTFSDSSVTSRTNEPHFGRTAIFVDYDHDNDLDLFVGNELDLTAPPDSDFFDLPDDFAGEINTLLRNNGNGTFTDQTDEAGLLVSPARTRAVLAADFDADYDVDLFVLYANAAARLFLNARLGKFTAGGDLVPPIGREGQAAAEGDFNHDGRPDLVVAAQKQLHVYLNDGQAHFTGSPVPLPALLSSAGAGHIVVCDINNDGWSDLLLASADGRAVVLLAGAGPGRFEEQSETVGLGTDLGWVADAQAADLDGDGDVDLLLATRDRGLRLLRNDGGSAGHWLTVRLVGKKVNRNGYGATVEIAAGGHYQKQTVRDGNVHFGLGDLSGVDVVRVTWPNGVAQNVIRPPLDRPLVIEQQVKVSASCGFLYAFNGTGFDLVNEILGIGPLGVPLAPGVYHQPDCTELTAISGRQLVALNDTYELRLTEELRETIYADQITLRVVDHPAHLEIVPNEYFTAPPFPEDKFFAVAASRPPVAAYDEQGTDVLPLVRERDGQVPTFPLTPYDGVAEPHTLTLDLGDLAGAPRVLLFLDGWIYWPESSTVIALTQDARYPLTPLTLETRDAQGDWQTAIASVGLPTSKGLVVPVDLTGRFPGRDYQVRLRTTLCVYFDRVYVATQDHADRCRMIDLPVNDAELHHRGFSRMNRDALGFERFDYTAVSPTGSWNPPRGRFTRYGAVTDLLALPDNRYVIFGAGDELTLRFDARTLPALPADWSRDYVFYANGWVKDGDLNTALSETVEPLPFHGMSGYPYPPSEHYPGTPDLHEYQRTYNTRAPRCTVGDLRRAGGESTQD